MAVLEKGAQLSHRYPEGDTLLGRALANELSETAVLLIEAGADPNLPDEEGDRPLHVTIATGPLTEPHGTIGSKGNSQVGKETGMGDQARADLVRVRGRPASFQPFDEPARVSAPGSKDLWRRPPMTIRVRLWILSAAICLAAAGCPQPVVREPEPPELPYGAEFDHRRNDAPPLILLRTDVPYYHVDRWVQVEAKPMQARQGWLYHHWFIQSPGEGATYNLRGYQHPETGIWLGDKKWFRFHAPGPWKIFLSVEERDAVACSNPACTHAFAELPFAGGTVLICPACGSATVVPTGKYEFYRDEKPRVYGKAVLSKPAEFLVVDIRPRRLVGEGEERRDDLPIITLFPSGGWVYTGERFQASLFGVRMVTDTGGQPFTQDQRVIRKVAVDFGDGTKVEEYENESGTDEIEHQLLDHLYMQNGQYEIRATITDSQGEEYVFTRQVLAVNKETSGMDRLVRSIMERLLARDIGADMRGKNVIVYNLENQDTYSDDVEISPLEDMMVHEFHRRGIRVLERDEDVMRRWIPEILGVLPNAFSQELQVRGPQEWTEHGDSLKVEAARPDFLVEYRIVALNQRLEPFRKFNPRTNRMESILEVAAGGMEGEGTSVQRMEVRKRKRVLNLYFRIIDGGIGSTSTRVVFTDVLTGMSEDFIVIPR